MKIGTIKELMEGEFRVGLSDASVSELVDLGHQVIVESGAGLNSGITDRDYINAGAKVVSKASDVWNEVDFLVKVKEPLKEEFKYFKKDLIIFAFLHLSAQKDLTEALIEKGSTAIALDRKSTRLNSSHVRISYA